MQIYLTRMWGSDATIPLVFISYLTNDTYLMRPYTKKKLTNTRCIFYYILSFLQKCSLDVRDIKGNVYHNFGTNMPRRRNSEFDR